MPACLKWSRVVFTWNQGCLHSSEWVTVLLFLSCKCSTPPSWDDLHARICTAMVCLSNMFAGLVLGFCVVDVCGAGLYWRPKMACMQASKKELRSLRCNQHTHSLTLNSLLYWTGQTLDITYQDKVHVMSDPTDSDICFLTFRSSRSYVGKVKVVDPDM